MASTNVSNIWAVDTKPSLPAVFPIAVNHHADRAPSRGSGRGCGEVYVLSVTAPKLAGDASRANFASTPRV